MTTFTITYKKQRTKELLQKTVSVRGEQCLEDVRYFPYFCGALVNLSIYLVPEYDLEDKRIYSIENVVFYVKGFFSISMHDVLEDLSLLALGSNQSQHVRHLLDNESLYECLTMLGVNPKEVLFVLLYALYSFENRPLLQKALDNADDSTFAKLYRFYIDNN